MQVIKPHLGRMFARCAKSLAIANGESGAASAYAQGQNWVDATAIIAHHKAVLTGLSTADLPPTAVGQDLSAAVRPRTVLGHLLGIRRVPLRTRILTINTGSSAAAFVGEGKAIPVKKLDLAGDTLPPLKVAALTVATLELIRSSTPNAEDVLTEDIVAACAQGLDVAFLDPANAGAARVSPASITYGITPLASTGVTLAAIDSDLASRIQALSDGGSDLTAATWVLNPRTALYLSRLRGSGGALAYPGLTVKGGTLMGLPALTSSAGVPIETGSPGFGTTRIVLVDGSQVILGDDEQADVDISTAAALQMEDAPTNATADGTATTLVSLYQAEAVGIRATLWMNWKLRRPFVSVLSGVAY